MELEKELKKMRSFSRDGEDLCTRIRIDLPFACEQQFYPERFIRGGGGGGGSFGKFQTLLGSNADRNPVPIFQMCLCKVKDSYSSKKNGDESEDDWSSFFFSTYSRHEFI